MAEQDRSGQIRSKPSGSKQSRLNELYAEYSSRFSDKEIVLGDGNINSRIAFVGEAPGRDEVRISKPFVGAAGQRLSEMLQYLGLEREKIFITNSIKYRLSKLNPKTGRIINRPASQTDIFENSEYLHKEIDIIKPELIVTLGNIPLRMLCGDGRCIGEHHGQAEHFYLYDIKYNLYPLYHPAGMIYNPALKAVNQADICTLKGLINIF